MKKYLTIALIFLLAASLLMTGCGEKEKEASEAKLPGGWVLDKIEHYVPEDHSSSSKISETSSRAESGDTHMRVTWSSHDIKNSLEQKVSLEASFDELPQSFAPGEEASITINTQSSFSANYESDMFTDGRFAQAYIVTPGRDDVMNPYAQLYAPALWYESGSDSEDIPLKMPSNAEGGEIVQFTIGLNEVPHLNGAPSVTYTYKWTE